MNDRPRYPSASDGPAEFWTALDSVTVLEPDGAPPVTLGEESSFLRLAMDAAHMGAWKVDLTEQKVYWSFHHHVLFDLDPRSFDNRFETVFGCIHPDDRQRAASAFWESVERLQPIQDEFRVVWRDGSIHWIATRGTVQAGSDGKPRFAHGVNWDCTDKKGAQGEIERRQAELDNLRRILESTNQNIPQLVWVADATGYTYYYNDRWYQYTGQTPEIAAGSGWVNALHRDDRARVAKLWYAAIRDEGAYDTEYRLLGADGEYRWFIARGTPVRDAAGKITGWFGTSTDITQRKQAEEALKASEKEARLRAEELAAILDAVPAATFIAHDREGRLMKSNRAAHDLFGLPEGWNISKSAPENATTFVVTKDGRELHPEELPVQRAAMTGEPVRDAELRITRADGRNFDLYGHAVPLKEENGVCRGAVGAFVNVTALNRAQRERDESNARFRTLFESDMIGFVISSLDGHCIESNDAFLRITGYTRADLDRELVNWRGLTPAEFATLDEAAIAEVAERGSCSPYEKEYVRRDGSRVHVLVGSTRSPGTSDQYLSFVLDLTAQKRAESERDESHARFRALFESDVIGFLISCGDGRCVESNDAFLRMVGYSGEEMQQGKVRWLDMTPPEFLPLDREGVRQVAEHGSCAPYEKAYYRKDGSLLPILLGYTQMPGTTDHYISFILDLTAQKRAELEARAREEQFKALADNLPQLVYVMDGQGRLQHCNKTFYAYTGTHQDTVMNGDWVAARASIVHPDDVAKVAQRWKHALATGEEYYNEVRLRGTDGKFRNFISRAVPVRDDAGRIVQWVASSTDVHDHRLAEEALRRSDKLAAASRLASSIAHEINNPLQAVTALVYLLGQEALLSDQGRELLRTAEQELARMSHTVTQALRFTRSSREPADTNLQDVVDSALELFRNRLSSAGVEVQREYAPAWPVLCSADEMRQVLAALVSNARDAMLNGGKLRVRVREARDRQGGGRAGVRVTVADTGSGIADEVRERIFEPFVTTKDATGTGLGLWVASEILRRHRGHIHIRSRAGVGTVVSMWVPKSRDEAP